MPTVYPGLSAQSPIRSEASNGSSWLWLRIHLRALRHAPRSYLTAAWWRLCGKRVRARAKFAPLLAASPLAYRLWQRGEKPIVKDGREGPPIIGLVDVRVGQGALEETLRSLKRESIPALVLGTPEIAGPADAVRHIDWAGNPWLMSLGAGDVLAPGASAAYRRTAVTTQAGIVYADDDLIDDKGERHAPHFKPRWNAELCRHFDYLAGSCIVRADALQLAAVSGPDWAGQLIAAVVKKGGKKSVPLHLPHILHHRRTRPSPVVPAASVFSGQLPPVSVIIPTRNRVDLLRTCIEGLARTDYPDMEVIVVDNGSDDPATLAYLDALDLARHQVLRAPGPFNFSALNNQAARQATGELLCLLNNDIEVLAPDWLAIMAHQALRKDVGAVGAQLLYPDGRIQHAGVVLGVGGGAAHAHRLLGPDDEGYFRRHALPQFVSAVTAACLVVSRQRYEAVGGLDEANFAVAFNDVDLCLRLNAQGWQTLYEPRAKLVHHESVSRGLDRDPAGAARLANELAALKARWNTDEGVDPYHHPHLNRFSEHFVVQL